VAPKRPKLTTNQILMELWPCGHVEPRALPVPRKSDGFLLVSGLCQPFPYYDSHNVSPDSRSHFGWQATKEGPCSC
jgi:hypothetical protein